MLPNRTRLTFSQYQLSTQILVFQAGLPTRLKLSAYTSETRREDTLRTF